MSKVVVFHSGYGCETGCCGHIVTLDDDCSKFEFTHPYIENLAEPGNEIQLFVRELVAETFGEEHIKDIDWDNCLVIDD